MTRLIIFDWDDVFTRGSTTGYYKCYHEAIEGVGMHLSPQEEDKRIKAKWGAGHVTQLEYILKENPELVQQATEIYRRHLFGDTFVDCLTAIPGVQDFLAGLAKRYTLALATGAHPDILQNRLFKKFHIPDVFAQIITVHDNDDPTHGKPHPWMIHKILKTQGIPAEDAVLVGDAASDMQMAWNAGVEPIAVLTGHLSRNEAESLGVKRIIDDVTQLEKVL